MRLPRHFHDEADGHAGILVRAAEGIHDEEPLVRELLHRDILQHLPVLLGERVVVVFVLIRSPPHRVFGVLVHNDVLILGRTASIDAGHDVDRAQLRQLPLVKTRQLRLQFLFIQKLKRGIVDDLRRSRDAILAQIDRSHSQNPFYIKYQVTPGMTYRLTSCRSRHRILDSL